MSMHSDIIPSIPSGRPRTSTPAGRAIIATSAWLGTLALLDVNPIVLALVGLGLLGSIVIMTGSSIKHEPLAMLV